MVILLRQNKNVPKAKAAPAGAGDVWTWTVLEGNITWGYRNQPAAPPVSPQRGLFAPEGDKSDRFVWVVTTIAFVVSGGSLVPTVLGPPCEICLTFMGGHDQGEAIVCGKAGFFESAA
jgi:hypothetical protein